MSKEEINIRMHVYIKGEMGLGEMWNGFSVNDYRIFSIYIYIAYIYDLHIKANKIIIVAVLTCFSLMWHTQKKGTSLKELPPSYWPISLSIDVYLNSDWCGRAYTQTMGSATTEHFGSPLY